MKGHKTEYSQENTLSGKKKKEYYTGHSVLELHHQSVHHLPGKVHVLYV